MKVDEQIRRNVIESLIEAKDIRNEELREQVYDAWAISLEKGGYMRIDDIPLSGGPDLPPVEGGTQTDHLRSVARLSVAIARELKDTVKGFDVDMDEVIAGGLCHDLGKPFEYNPENRERWKSDPRITGSPSIRHPVYGVYVALSAGLPEKIAHIAGAHSAEGENVKRSLVGEIVHYADKAFWRVLANAGFFSF